jgi:MSHA biogenesis protein MshK
MATSLKTALMISLFWMSGLCAAESLPDPTRPAIDLNGSGENTPVQAEVATVGLQSTIISPEYRAAVINGKTVRLGGSYGDSKLIEVRENSIVLQNARGTRVMELFPKVNIKKNKAAQRNSQHVPEVAGEADLPEKAVGENK